MKASICKFVVLREKGKERMAVRERKGISCLGEKQKYPFFCFLTELIFAIWQTAKLRN